jgi:transglutaminase-like putative cysteine protease
MVYRFSWIAGIAAIALAFWELSFVMRDSVVGTPWQLAIIISVVLAAGITWTFVSYKARALVIIVANLFGFVITAGLLVAPSTLWVIVPTTETWTTIQFEMMRAFDVIRFGVEPVRPVPGLVLLLAALFWILGFLLVAGLLNSRPFIAVMTPLIVALQFVIIDRRPKGLIHVAVFLAVVAFAFLAIRLDERDKGSGRLHRVDASHPPSKRPTPAVTVLVTATVVAALAAVASAGNLVPTSGFVTWRSPAGYSDDYSGSVSYNPYTDIKASLISQSSLPLFEAKVTGMAADQVRYRTVTLDVYHNGRWQTDRIQAFPTYEEPWVTEAERYRGETVEVATTIRIKNLAQPWLPAPPTSSFASALDEADDASLRIRRLDGSVYLPGDVTYPDMEYSIVADVPRYDAATLASLIHTDDGTLSPLFQAAEDGGEFIPAPSEPLETLELDRIEFWTEVPEELGPGVAALAADVTTNLETNYEKALALEQYFRFSGDFTYSTDVPAQYTTSSVEDWLTDPENPYVRTGYCEQFATSMALMARTLGVPSRVVLGFTPGEPINDTTVVVTDRNAHSWVEIWVPELGWMAFDPTPRAGFAASTANDDINEILGFSPDEYIDDIPDPVFVDTEGGQAGPDEGRFDREDPVERIRGAGGGSTEDNATGFGLLSWSRETGIVIAILALMLGTTPLVKVSRRRRLSRRLAQGDIQAAWADITSRLADLGETIDPASTPLEAASDIDEAFVPLARTYGDTIYGDHEVSTAVINRATDEQLMAQRHITTRYSRLDRARAAYRPTMVIERYRQFRIWLATRNGIKRT